MGYIYHFSSVPSNYKLITIYLCHGCERNQGCVIVTSYGWFFVIEDIYCYGNSMSIDTVRTWLRLFRN